MTGATPDVSLSDVARHAGVSLATASRALADRPHVAPATRARVLAAATELDYVASPEASRLAGGPRGTGRGRVAVVVPHLTRWYFGELLEGLEASLRDDDLDVLLFRVGDAAERRAFFERLPARRRVDALVVLAFPVDEGERRRLVSMGLDIVAAGGQVGAFPSVGIDDRLAARQALDHLVHLGHRRIGMIAAADPDQHEAAPHGRTDAHTEVVGEAGLDPDPGLVVAVPHSGEGGADGMARLLGLRDPPTAVFAQTDEIALGALRTLRRAGLGVPADVSVVGVDGHPLAGLADLTTVVQPVREQGRVAGRMVRDALAGGGGESLESVVLPTHLVVRGTTAPPRVVGTAARPSRDGRGAGR